MADPIAFRVWAFTGALLLAGCSAPAAPPGEGSGAWGQATLGPTCPVQRVPPDPACEDKPYQGSLVVTMAEGSTVLKTFTTSATGSFNVSLPPGNYAIRNPQESHPYPRCGSDGNFTVAAHAYAEVVVRCDTGIR